jgi:N-acyl-L-homoserine lactone synthetase
MIDLITYENAHLYGAVLPSIHRLRYREFVERLDYDVPVYNKMEYDQYDNFAAVQLVWLDEDGEVQGTVRLSPTDRPYMIKDLWPQIVETRELPESPMIWEATRMCIERSYPKEKRDRIHAELLCAMQEFAISRNLTGYIGVAPPGLWKFTFLRYHWPIQFLGETHIIDSKEKIRAGWMDVSEEILNAIKRISGIDDAIILNQRTDQGKAAA